MQQLKLRQTFLSSVFDIIRLTLGYGISKRPKVLLLQLFIGVYLIYCLHINAIFTGKLSGVLTAPNYEPRLKTLEDLADSSIVPVIRRYSLQRFRLSQTKTARRLLQKTKEYQVSDSAFYDSEYVKINGSIAMAQFKDLFNFVASRKYIVDTIDDNNYIWTIQGCFVFRRGIPILLTMNQVIRGIREGGLVRKWVSDEVKISFRPDSPKTVILTIEHLQGAFLMLVIGSVLSLLIFFVEVLMGRVYLKNVN